MTTDTNGVLMSHNAQTSLLHWNLPSTIVDCYHKCGITRLFDWQAECLGLDGVLAGRNLVYAAPTSAGKTLVAEILTLKRCLERKGKGLFILPYVSVARQKLLHMQEIFQHANLRVEGFMGNLHAAGGVEAFDLAICTIEKANNLINRLIDEQKIHLLGTVVVDELHMVGEAQRGVLVELLLTKLMFLRNERNLSIQVIGMSATLPNLCTLAAWLNAAEMAVDFRPVPLTEMLKLGQTLYAVDMKPHRTLAGLNLFANDTDNVLWLVVETVQCGHGVIVFCSTKAWCESLAETLARGLHSLLCGSDGEKFPDIRGKLRSVLNAAVLKEFVEEFRRVAQGTVDAVLAKTLGYGVAYHHAGLTSEERESIERGFRHGILRVLVATSTLSSGVNLPARRVIIRSVWGSQGQADNSKVPCLTATQYKQMAGRAGREGIDTEGESVLICQQNDVKRAKELLTATLPPVRSGLRCFLGPVDNAGLSPGFKRTLLEAIANRLANTLTSVKTYLQCTLFAVIEQSADEASFAALDAAVDNCLNYLLHCEFVTISEGGIYTPTQLGSATLASALSPDEALSVFRDLRKAAQGLNLENEVHLVYLTTPIYMQDAFTTDWHKLYEVWCCAPEDLRRAGKCIGVHENFLIRAVHMSTVRITDPQKLRDFHMAEAVHKRFFVALALHDLINERSLSEVAEKFGCTRGILQALQQQASSYAGMVVAFCDRLGWHYFRALLAGFAERLAFGVRRDLTDLVRIDGLDGARARVFHNAGYSTVASLSNATQNEIVSVLRRAVPFRLAGDTARSRQKHGWLAGHPDVSEGDAAQLIIRRAQEIVQERLRNLGLNALPVGMTKSDLDRTKANCNKTNTIDNDDFVTANNARIHMPQRLVDQLNDSRLSQPEPPVAKSVDMTNVAPFTVLREPLLAVAGEVEPNRLDQVELRQWAEESEDSLACLLADISRVSISPVSSPAAVGQHRASFEPNTHRSLTESQAVALVLNDSSFHLNHTRSGRPRSSQQLLCDEDKENNVTGDTPTLFDDAVLHDISSPDPLAMSSPVLLSHSQSHYAEDKNVPAEQRKQTVRRMRLDNSSSTPTGVEKKRPRHNARACTGEGFERLSLKQLITSHPTAVCGYVGSTRIVNVCSDSEMFEAFARECRVVERICFAFSYQYAAPVAALSTNNTDGMIVDDEEGKPVAGEASGMVKISGLLVCWSTDFVYNIPLDALRGAISKLNRVSLINDLLWNVAGLQKVAFDAKSELRKLLSHSLLDFEKIGSADLFCCTLAAWLFDSDALVQRNDLCSFLRRYATPCADLSALLNLIEQQNFTVAYPYPARSVHQAAVVVLVSQMLVPTLTDNLKSINDQALWKVYLGVEMPALKSLLKMESHGVGFDVRRCEVLCDELRTHLDTLQKEAFFLAKRRFSLTAHQEIAKILFVELQLPPEGQVSKLAVSATKTGYRHYSTAKEVLQKLIPLHPLPGVILEWRRCQSALTKCLLPLLRHAGSGLSSDDNRRIFGVFDMHTATGRMIMLEPSLQTIPRDFAINANLTTAIDQKICLRSLFLARPGHVLISVDYSQLELRLLAHLCEDEKLIELLRRPTGDVFRIIAASWKNVAVNEVTADLRQQAKQICYGMIYGMHAKSLAEQLGVSEDIGTQFLDSFKAQFPGVSRWITTTIASCRQLGFVKTLGGRRRYLPSIKAHLPGPRSHAERQAVNTSVQGSAADLFKTAMVAVQRELHSALLHAQLVLQLHDELLLEVPVSEAADVSRVVRSVMENAWSLVVPLPVRIKSGPTWGALEES